MTLAVIALAAFLATLLGGWFALHFKDRLHLILGFSAGAVVAVAFFDLIPEALELTEGVYDSATVLTLTTVGFGLYLALDRLFLRHGHAEHSHSHRSTLGVASLAIHSFLDGIGVGLAFQVSPTVGAVVAAAVLAHDFSDGINTVGMVLGGDSKDNMARRWLFIDALAPVLGIITTTFFSVPEAQLGLLLAVFAGFFLYIGASDLIPESHHNHPARWTTVMTIAGMIVIFAAIRLAGV